jgi:hypothetical protein
MTDRSPRTPPALPRNEFVGKCLLSVAEDGEWLVLTFEGGCKWEIHLDGSAYHIIHPERAQ